MDLDSDGNDDLLASGYCGTTFVFYRNGDGTFSKGKLLRDEKGNPVNAGRYELAIKSKAFYTVEKEKALSSLAVTAVDWDNDGDYDLVMNTSHGIRLCKNKGNKRIPKFSSSSALLSLNHRHFVFDYTDWDGDGLWDILCGGKDGGVFLYKNKGKIGKPKFKKALCLLSIEDVDSQNCSTSSCQISVTDFNNDGKKDILLGGRSRIYKWKEDLSKNQKTKLRKSIKIGNSYYNKSRIIYDDLHYEYLGNKSKYLNAVKESKKMKKLSRKVSDYYYRYSKYVEIEDHSYVYVIYGK